ncbi:Xylulose kinase [subsurface metagenome]|jgi:xylulokinase
MKKYILAHDIGTTGNKAAIFNEKGKMLASSYIPYPTYYIKSTWVEQDPDDWWKAVCNSTKEVLKIAKKYPSDIAVISFSGQMMSNFPFDRDGNCLRKKVIIWADARANEQSKKILEKVGFDRYYNTTASGQVIESYAIAKILWQKENEPEIYNKVYKFLFAKDYIICKLTGNFVTDFSDASNAGLFDINKREWAKDILETIGLDLGKLPDDICDSTKIVGKIKKDVSEEIGLLSGTPVVVGAGDMIAAATGAGLIEEGDAYIYMGSSSWLGVSTKKPLFDLDTRILTICHAIPGLYAPHHTMFSAGICNQWARDIFYQAEKAIAEKANVDIYQVMDKAAEKVKPGSEGIVFLPYMRGGGAPYHDPNARGAFIGLNLAHERGHLVRSILEGVAFNINMFLENITSKGIGINEIRFVGGGAKSKLWSKILADITGKTIVVTELSQEANSLGAAILGGIGVDLIKDLKEAKNIVAIKEKVHPTKENQEIYKKYFKIFKDSYKKNKDIFNELVQI